MTPKITVSPTLPKKATDYCRIILTEEPQSHHRLIEAVDGSVSYRMGVGKWSEVTPRTFRTIVRSIIQAAKGHRIEKIIIDWQTLPFPQLESLGHEWIMSTLVENLILANYEFTVYKSKQKDYRGVRDIAIIAETHTAHTRGHKRGEIVATMTNKARDIANTHGDDLTPKVLATTAVTLAKGTPIEITVLNRAAIKKEKLNLLHAVGKGSHHEEQFIIMTYRGKSKKGAKLASPLVLIGKGITYDTGGLNVKPAGHMHDMHMDMSGGSAVMAAIVAAAKLGLKKDIVALIPAAENAISSTSMRAGDIVTAHNGTTVEILHTDAEGRLALADALSYSARFKPGAIIDVATLTGAAVVALGQQASALMSNDEALTNTLRTLGERSGDLVWPLPLWDEYKQSLKSARADISNIATSFSKYGGCIEGGIFLSHFAPKGVPWAHLDIAPRMESIQSDKLAKGSTGEPVRLLVQFLETY